MTNKEKILSMTDKELAEFLSGMSTGYNLWTGYYLHFSDGTSICSKKEEDLPERIVNWLQSECE